MKLHQFIKSIFASVVDHPCNCGGGYGYVTEHYHLKHVPLRVAAKLETFQLWRDAREVIE